MIETIVNNTSGPTININAIQRSSYKKWLSGQSNSIQNWLSNIGFDACPGNRALIPNNKGEIETVLFVISNQPNLWEWAALPKNLPPGLYQLNKAVNPIDASKAALAWALETYNYSRYQKKSKPFPPKLLKPPQFQTDEAISTYLVRDLINTPANDMGPADLANASKAVAKEMGADFSVIIGSDLLKSGYPSIHAVGRAHNRAPRLIDMRWGNTNAPKLTLIGKGVCFDTGGLNLKTSTNMNLMKKDMGGAAHALGLARLVISAKINVRLRLLIPAVENSVSANAIRPGDVIRTRKGITIEIGNTDAEGRVILADALAEASSENPDAIVNFATLTGAARIALGTELPAFFCNNEAFAKTILTASKTVNDPLWQMPLWQEYKSQISGKIADLSNSGSSRFGGAITAALFLEHFIEPHIPWAHLDIMAWNSISKPGRPEGGEAMSMRAIFAAISEKFG